MDISVSNRNRWSVLYLENKYSKSRKADLNINDGKRLL